MSARLYIKKTAGYFPGADSVEKLWQNLLDAKVAPTSKLAQYWKLTPADYAEKDKDTFISIDSGHLADYPFSETKFPRQIQAAIDVGRDLLNNAPHSPSECGLVIATEWTDPSFYEAALGQIPQDKGFSVESQIETIKNELAIKGPALAVDTACASSLYALELARGMLTSGQVKSVIVIGLNLYLHSFLYRGFTKLGALSKKGALTSFDVEADGIVPGEAACGILLDSSFDGAIAEIDGIGLSADGNEGSAFSPGFYGQIEAYRRAYRESSVEPKDIDFLEAHGTATVLGDETECSSIHEFFNRSPGKEIVIGSSKSNVGHTLAASGLVSLIKCAMIIHHRTLPPHIKFRPHPSLARKGIRTLEKPLALDKKQIAVAISSFGFGGSNAHIVLKTPSASKFDQNIVPKKFFVRAFEEKGASEFRTQAPVLQGVPMGPKMQERYDHLQRLTLHGVQTLVSGLSAGEKKSLSCVVLNNLGGTLSLDFERKYRKLGNGPQLSIEGIASTLPSMMSGNPCMLFDFRGHHMLISGMKGSLADVLSLCPYLLVKAEGDIVLGIAHKNIVPSSAQEALALFYISLHEETSIASVEPDGFGAHTEDKDLGEASGLDRFIYLLNSGEGEKKFEQNGLSFKVRVRESVVQLHKKLKEEILKESLQNKSIALEYLNLLSSLRPDEIKFNSVGSFLKDCEKSFGKASGELIVDESHPYFFDHPLDHVPGILSIHGCEELLQWYLNDECFITFMNIRFIKFLEKDEPIKLHLEEKDGETFEFSINQGKKKAGTLLVKALRKRVPVNLSRQTTSPVSEDKKITHKHREENVLVSKLENGEASTALPLLNDKSPFFRELNGKRPSTLYFAEVTRQFVMLMAHLRKGIPLSTKMNLINTEITLEEWVTPPFELHLADFTLTETDNFLLAEVKAEFRHEGKVFGHGKIKAQVVSAEYYQVQRSES